MITFSKKGFKPVHPRQYFLTVWKHASVVSIPKPGEDLKLPSSDRHIPLINLVFIVFERFYSLKSSR
jgi:hypothetical protein